MIESLSSWFTPTVLFCILNLMIGTILITSSLKKDKNHQQHNEDNLPPTPSLVHRVRSVNLPLPDLFSPFTQFTHNSLPQLGPSPSFLQRVRSVNFSFSRSENPCPFPSLDDETVTEEEDDDLQGHVRRSKSATREESTTMNKLASGEKKQEEEEEEVVVRRRPATLSERKGKRGKKSFGGNDEAVDRKADDFISKFREQLKMQRIDSILRSKEMLNRGVSI